MIARVALAAPLAAALASLASAQVATVVGPQVAPAGCPVAVSISNDTAADAYTKLCPFRVFDAATGADVYAPFCAAIAVTIAPGDTFTTSWDQRDDFGNPVPPGAYVVEVQAGVGGSLDLHPITVGGADASVAPLGVPKIGTTRAWQLCAPLDGAQLYLMAASGSSSVGIPTCGGTFPLDVDPILEASLSDPTVFINTFGALDAVGMTSAPSVAIPANPAFAGLSVHFAMMVLDFGAPCPFRRFSAPMVVTLS